jgi:hypothetical protein
VSSYTDQEEDESLNCHNLIGVEETGTSKCLFCAKPVLIDQIVLLNTEISFHLWLFSYHSWDMRDQLTSSVVMDVTVAKYIENIRASVLLLNESRLPCTSFITLSIVWMCIILTNGFTFSRNVCQ